MPRFFVEQEPAGRVFLGGESGAHLVRSLRARPGEEVILCAGTGLDFRCVVQETGPEGAWLQVEGSAPSRGEPRVQITVCPCWPKGEKLDWIVQKSVELGAAAVWPLFSGRCVSRPQGGALPKRMARLRKIALEAAQQAGRGKVPPVLDPAGLPEALAQAAGEGTVLFCYERGTAPLREALGTAGDRLFLVTGPEGGFDPAEAALAEGLGALPLTLGPRILRAETAPLAALAAALYEKGELDP